MNIKKILKLDSLLLLLSIGLVPGRALGQEAPPPEIIDRPIRFDAERRALTLAYIKRHYGLALEEPVIVPRAVVVHWTGTGGLEGTWRAFNRVRMRAARRYLLRGGEVNVSAHFLVDRTGRIYRLMPETLMARHCIGLNLDSIGIENIGGPPRWPLTRAQLLANAALIRALVARHPIRTLIGHMEWKLVERTPIFRELDPSYRNAKADPGPEFMAGLRRLLADLDLEPRRPDPRPVRRSRPSRRSAAPVEAPTRK